MKVLHFSGGIDSLATLFVKRPEWEEITVLWCDTGMAYPETYEYMERIKKLVPHFHVARSDKAAWENSRGIGVDVVPETHTILGRTYFNESGGMYAPFLHCCAANIWAPMEKASRELGATTIIRGQKAADRGKAPHKSGYVHEGVTYEFPIESWTRADVFAYCVKECPDYIPHYYSEGELTSRDCWDCIAYLWDNERRIQNLPFERREVVMKRLAAYAAAIAPGYSRLQRILL